MKPERPRVRGQENKLVDLQMEENRKSDYIVQEEAKLAKLLQVLSLVMKLTANSKPDPVKALEREAKSTFGDIECISSQIDRVDALLHLPDSDFENVLLAGRSVESLELWAPDGSDGALESKAKEAMQAELFLRNPQGRIPGTSTIDGSFGDEELLLSLIHI